MRKLSSLSFAVLIGLSAGQTHAAELLSVDTNRAIEVNILLCSKPPRC